MSQALPLRGPLKTCGVNAATVQCTSCDTLEMSSCTSATPGRTLQQTRFPLLATADVASRNSASWHTQNTTIVPARVGAPGKFTYVLWLLSWPQGDDEAAQGGSVPSAP